MHLKNCRVVIVGLGLMGGSLGLALRGKCRSISGHDLDPLAVSGAVDRGAVDRFLDNPASLLQDADLVVLATPVNATLGLLSRLADPERGPVHLLDLGSTKKDVVEAMAGLPTTVSPIGGHPMCGKEVSGIGAADGELFRDKVFVLTPLERTEPDTLRLAKELVEAIGARPLLLDPDSHDRIAAMVSHGPYLVAAALVEAARLPGHDGVEDLATSGFQDTTRIAASDVTMMLDVLLSNRAPTLEAVARVEEALRQLSIELRRGDRQALGESLHRIRSWRKKLPRT